MTADLVTWLRAQLDWQEELAQRALQADPIDFVGLVSPRWLLRDIEAKRALIAETIRPYLGVETTAGRVAWLTLRLLALPYADRPGYRSEWAP